MKTMMKVVVGMVMVGVMLASAMRSTALARTGAVGSYNGVVNSNAYEPGKGQILDSTGTIWDTVDDYWTRFSTNTGDSAIDKTCLNVRVSTKTSIPVALTVTVTNLKIDGTSNTVQLDATKMGAVGISGSSNTVQLEDNGDWISQSSSCLVYPNNTAALTINAAVTGAHFYVQAGSAAITTSWGGIINTIDSFPLNQQFDVPVSSPATLSVALGYQTTGYFTLDFKRKIR